MWKQLTGEPVAGELHSGFGGRGRRLPFPTPIHGLGNEIVDLLDGNPVDTPCQLARYDSVTPIPVNTLRRRRQWGNSRAEVECPLLAEHGPTSSGLRFPDSPHSRSRKARGAGAGEARAGYIAQPIGRKLSAKGQRGRAHLFPKYGTSAPGRPRPDTVGAKIPTYRPLTGGPQGSSDCQRPAVGQRRDATEAV